jgi:threonylcarbamoyladenosine tRNA methylthiotransferase MtaB
MRVAFTTFGCKINQHDTEIMRQRAAEEGGTIVPFDSEADVYVINTCSVTGKADYQCRQSIRAAARRASGARIIVTGCYAETRPEEIRQIAGVTHVLGNKGKPDIGPFLTCAGEHVSTDATRRAAALSRRTRGVLKIQDGCDSRCSYCIVPQARGGSRSIPLDAVIRSFEDALQDSVPEVVLSGIHIGRYGLDLRPATTLSLLLTDLVRRRGNARVRLSSIEPGEVTPEIIALLGSGICRHLHIPLQSGDDRILRAMNRQYSAAQYRTLVESIAVAIPDVALGTDVMVGFPGEDDEAFENTYALIAALPLTHLHVFSYSRRPGTTAAEMHRQVPESVKKDRNERLRKLGLKKNLAFREQLKGKRVEIVVEDAKDGAGFSGLTDNYVRIMIENEKECSTNGILSVIVSDVSMAGTKGSAERK